MNTTEAKPKDEVRIVYRDKIIYKDLSEKKTGAPSKYKEEYCQQMIDHFSIEPYKEVVILNQQTTKDGMFEKEERRLMPNKLPTFFNFAMKIGVNGDTIVEWSKIHAKFSAAYEACKLLQKEFMINVGMSGTTPPASFIFVAKNITDMRDKVFTEEENKVPDTQITLNNFENKNILNLNNQDLISKMKELRNNA